jgi:hypothetical protein
MTPSRRLLQLLLAWTVAGLAASVLPPLVPVFRLAGGALLLAAAADAWQALRAPHLRIERQLSGVLPVDV